MGNCVFTSHQRCVQAMFVQVFNSFQLTLLLKSLVSDLLSENRSKSLLIRSACIVLLLGVSYGLQHFNETHELAVPFETAADRSGLERAEPSLDTVDLRRAKDSAKNGDLVFRSGNTWLSNMAEQVDPDVTYTHVGVITLDRGEVKVVHASIDGESLVETLGNRVVEEPLDDFLQKGNATHAAIYRLREPSAQLAQHTADNAAAIAKTYAVKSVPFDSGFDLLTADKVYCTELIWRVYLDAGVDLTDQGLESFSFPFSGQYLTPDSLAKSEKLQPVYQVNQNFFVNSDTP